MTQDVKIKIDKVRCAMGSLQDALEQLCNELPSKNVGILTPNFDTSDIGIHSSLMDSWLSIDEIEDALANKDYLDEEDFDF